MEENSTNSQGMGSIGPILVILKNFQLVRKCFMRWTAEEADVRFGLILGVCRGSKCLEENMPKHDGSCVFLDE